MGGRNFNFTPRISFTIILHAHSMGHGEIGQSSVAG
jgi:hypothetical protein